MNTTDTTTIPRPLRRGRRYLSHLGGMLLVTAFLVVAAAACQPAGCATDCIGIVNVDPGGTQVTFPTTVNTFATLELFSDPNMTNLVIKKSDPGINSAHTIPVGQLSPYTNYWWRVTAIDANNLTRTDVGSFTTDTRSVTVTLTHINLIDDSDALGSGELSFHLGVNGSTFLDAYDNNDMSSGQQVNLNIPETVGNTTTPLTIHVEGWDDDCDLGDGPLCVGGLGADWSHGSTSEADWATGTFGPIALSPYDSSGNWSVSTTAYKLKFTASGTYQVHYYAP